MGAENEGENVSSRRACLTEGLSHVRCLTESLQCLCVVSTHMCLKHRKQDCVSVFCFKEIFCYLLLYSTCALLWLLMSPGLLVEVTCIGLIIENNQSVCLKGKKANIMDDSRKKYEIGNIYLSL